MFLYYLMFLPSKVHSILEKLGRKRYWFRLYSTSCIKIIFALPTEVVAFYMQVLIVEIRISGLEWLIVGHRICLELAMFLASNE